MPNDKPKQVFIDTLGTFEGGVNSYLPTLLLPKNNLSTGLNTTVRRNYVTQRSILRKIYIDPDSQIKLDTAIAQGEVQAATYFKPDFGPEGIACIIGGQIMSIFPAAEQYTALVSRINTWLSPAWAAGAYTQGDIASSVVNGVNRDFKALTTMGASAIAPPDDPGNWKMLNAPTGENWVWQSEMFLIWNDGTSNPIFYNVNTGTARRSTFGQFTIDPQNTALTTAFTVPAVGVVKTGVVVTSTTNMVVGQAIYFSNFGNMQVALVQNGTTVDLVNKTITPGLEIPAATGITWSKVFSDELPPGRMGTYGMGRNWFSGTDGVNFYASDGVGGASGTPALNYRDAPLHMTENFYLAGGGSFLVPGAVGSIQAMRFVSNLDQSLGQGPLQVFTRYIGFSCRTPVDRLTWQDVSNPILTESIKGYGATGQDATINVNSDLLFRSPIGFSSQILARRDFDTWGNVPISIEVSEITNSDNQTLLNFGSAINFDNRVLWTAAPERIGQGVIHKLLVPLNLDPISSLRGKAPSVYDATRWTGLNVFKIVTGTFFNRERAFAISWNHLTRQIEIYEILPTANTSYLDNDIVRITWAFNTASLFRETSRIFKRLVDGEIYVDQLRGTVDFQAWWKPDQYPCFQPWIAWQECQTQPRTGSSPGFRPRMGLGAPPTAICDPTTNRQLVLGYTFDLRFVITGAVRFLGGKFKAIEADEPEFSQPNCANAALLRAMQQVGSTAPTPPTPIPPNVVVLIDSDGNIVTDAGSGVILG